MITDTELAWMAGIIDLKASFITKKNQQRATSQFTMYVESQHQDIINELCAMTGVAVQGNKGSKLKDFSRRGCIEHCPDNHIHSNIVDMPKVYRWTVTGVALAIVLYNLQPYLRANKLYFQKMVECFDNVVPQGQGRGAIEKAIHRLKELGWKIPSHVNPPREIVNDEAESDESHSAGDRP